MLKRLDRLIDRLSQSLMPGVIRSADQRMLLRWPMLWRSRLLPLCWYALLAAAVGLAISMALQMNASSAWTLSQIDNATASFQLLGLIAAIYWWRATAQYPISELDGRCFLRVSCYYLLGLFALLLPAQTFYAGITYRVQGVIPDEQFQKDYLFHKEHDFWCCTYALDEGKLREHEDRLRASLLRFGFTIHGNIEPVGDRVFYRGKRYIICKDPSKQFLMILDQKKRLRPELLKERLEGIKWSKEIWSGGWTAFMDNTIHRLRFQFIILLIASVALGVTATPKWQRERFLGKRGRAREQAYRLWLPGLLRRLDRRLLLNTPMLWATRFHVFLFHSLTIGLVLGILVVFTIGLFGKGLLEFIDYAFKQSSGTTEMRQIYFIYTLLGLIAISPILWAVSTRRYHIPASNPGQWRRLAGTFFLAALPLPILLTAVTIWVEYIGKVDASDWMQIIVLSSIINMIAVSQVVAGKIIHNYSGPGMTLMAMAVGVPLIFVPVPIVQVFDLGETATFLLCAILPVVWAIAILIVSRKGSLPLLHQSRHGTRAASLLIGIIPATAVWAVLAAGLPIEVIGMSSSSANIIMASFYFTAILIGFSWGLSRSLRAIVMNRNRPQAE